MFRSKFFWWNLLAAAILILSASLTGCGVAGRAVPAGVHTVAAGGEGSVSGATPAATSRSLGNIQNKLYQAHGEWEGTPYRLGGNSKNGVDCSALTQIVFDNHFGIDLPRNTRQQLREGRGVRRSSVMPGDLIFFRTTRTDLHVGIALNGEEFLHASTTMGVMISSMNERYWSDRFLGVRRILL